MNVNGRDYERMSWHQRQQLNDRLRRETRELIDQLDGIRTGRIGVFTNTVPAIEARRILAGLPPDPDAATHRHDLNQALVDPRNRRTT